MNNLREFISTIEAEEDFLGTINEIKEAIEQLEWPREYGNIVFEVPGFGTLEAIDLPIILAPHIWGNFIPVGEADLTDWEGHTMGKYFLFLDEETESIILVDLEEKDLRLLQVEPEDQDMKEWWHRIVAVLSMRHYLFTRRAKQLIEEEE